MNTATVKDAGPNPHENRISRSPLPARELLGPRRDPPAPRHLDLLPSCQRARLSLSHRDTYLATPGASPPKRGGCPVNPRVATRFLAVDARADGWSAVDRLGWMSAQAACSA